MASSRFNFRLFLFIGIFLFANILFAQNLVLNPGFEDYDYLPVAMNDTGNDFTDAIQKWYAPNTASTDLINPRFKTKRLTKIPPKSGKNMAGIVVHGDHWAEYVAIKLDKPLVPGNIYYAEFWIATPDMHAGTKTREKDLHDHFGIRFDKRILEREPNIFVGSPQIYANSKVKLKPQKWVKVYNMFTADSSYTHLYIGQFQSPQGNKKLLKGYFFIDDVVVELLEEKAEKYVKPHKPVIDGKELENIFFDVDKYELLAPSFPTLGKVKAILETHSEINLEIHGHTDDTGDVMHNKELSENRAAAVYQHLVDNGIDPARLSYKGFGKDRPLGSNKTEEGRQQNRRVEFYIAGTFNEEEGWLDEEEQDKMAGRSNGKKKSTAGLTKLSDLRAKPKNYFAFSDDIKKTEHVKMSFIGKNVRDWECPDVAPTKKFSKASLEGYKPVDAAKYIIEQSQEEQVVFINEHGANPQHRVFMTTLLKDFYNNGFQYLALEDMSHVDQELNDRGYPIQESGFLMNEPRYGEMVRHAIELGFKVIPYRATAEELEKATQIVKTKTGIKNEATLKKNAAHWAQAMNITRVLTKNPDAKILVFASWENVREAARGDLTPMAVWFRQLAKRNPLTIDQTTMSEYCSNQQPEIYKKRKVQKPSVFTMFKRVFVQGPEDSKPYDIQVFHPRTRYVRDRPDWLKWWGDKVPVSVNLDKYNMDYPCIIMAYRKSEDIDTAVPVDVIEKATNESKTVLMLKPGDYNLVLKSKQESKKVSITASPK